MISGFITKLSDVLTDRSIISKFLGISEMLGKCYKIIPPTTGGFSAKFRAVVCRPQFQNGTVG